MSVKLKYIQETLAFIAKNGYESDQIKFLKSTAVFLAELFNVDYVLIDKYLLKNPTVTESIVVYSKGKFLPNISYKLENTPCENVINNKVCHYPSNVKALFPKDDLLMQMNVDSYVGTPLWSSNKEPIGLIALMDDKPIIEEKNIETVLGIIAIKVEEVLEKMFLENQLNLKIEELIIAKEKAEKNEEKLKILSNLAFEGILIHDTLLALDFNASFLKMFGYEQSELLGKNMKNILFPKKHHKTILEERARINTLPYEIEGIKKDGTIFPIEIVAKNFIDKTNKTIRVAAIRDITERRKSAIENKKLVTAIEQSANTIIITDDIGNIEYTNPKFTEITGYSAAEVLGKNPRVLSTGKQPKEFYSNLWQTITAGNIWKGEFQNKAKNGNFYWERTTITPIKNEAGEISSYLAIKEDISKNKEAEEKLQKATEEIEKSEKKFRELFEKSGDAILIIKNGVFVECNQATLKMLGHKKYEDVLNLQPSDLSPKFQPDGLSSSEKAEALIKITLEKGTHRFEWWHTKSNGELFPVEVLLTTIENEPDNQIIHCVWRDITERKLAENELQDAYETIKDRENFVSKILETANEGFWLIDEKANTIDLNAEMCKILGYSETEVKGKSIYDFVDEKNFEIFKNQLENRKIGESSAYEIELRNANGKNVPCLFKTSPIFNNQNEVSGSFALVSDITNIKETLYKVEIQNLELRKLSNELSEKNRLLLESKDRFINLFEQNPIPLWEQDFSKVIKLLNEKNSETKDLKNYLDKNPDFVDECISNIKILNSNKASLELFGVKNVEELKRHLGKTNNQKALEVLKKELVSIGANKKTFRDETELAGKDGLHILALIKSVIIDDYGTSIASVIDITAERKATDELSEQKLLFEKMFNAIHDAIIITNTNREIVLANKSVKNLFGYSPEELPGKSAEILYADNSKFEKAGDKVFNEHSINKDENYVTYYKTKENVIFPGETFGSKLFNNQGKWIGNIGVIRNIADRLNFINELEKAKEIAEKSENNLNEAQKISNIGSYEFDFSTGFWNCSPALNEIFGIDEKYNRNIDGWLGIVHPEDKTMMAQYFERNIIKNKEQFNKDYRILRNNDKQTRWVNGRGKLEFDHQGNLKSMIGTIQDISEKRQILQDFIIAKEKAEESNQLKTEFIQNMSHEIRTPMNGILGFTDLLENPNLPEEKRKRFIEIIKNSTHQLLHIIDDLMEISVLETKQIKAEEQPVCLNDLLFELFTVFEMKATKKSISLVLENELSDKESTILTDKNKLNKVLSNLLENALKFTNEGIVELGYKLNKDIEPVELEIYVKDSGIGIKPEKQALIFERFSQAEKELSKKVGGLGLGLSIAKENTELLGGKITVVSELGKGAAFFVTILYKPVNLTQKIENEKIKEKVVNEKKHTILITEDEDVNYMVLEILLEDKLKFPCIIIHAKDGLEAVELCKSNPEIELVLMDIKMPKMDGREATRIIKEFRPNLPIIAQTAYSSPEEKEKAFLAGCDDFLSKPINKEDLDSKLKNYLLTV
ncbi:MAG: PAS domain S-box protein [Lutibacter sp.]